MSKDNAGGSDNELTSLTSEELIERLTKAEAKIVDMKKSTKGETKEVKKEEETSSDMTSDKVAEIVAKALADAKTADEDATREANQKKTNDASIDGGAAGKDGFNKVKIGDFDKMTPELKKDYMKNSEAKLGEVMFDNSTD